MQQLETPEITERRLKLELRLAQMEETQSCQENFVKFVKKVWP